jgi:hypothetical protein
MLNRILASLSTRTIARLAALVTLINIPIHAHWALGGTFLLPASSQMVAANDLRAVNWAVSLILLAGAAAIWTLPSFRRTDRPPRRLTKLYFETVVFFIGVGAVVCISHALFGFLTKGLYIAGLYAVDFPGALTEHQKWSAAVIDLLVFEPWFLLEGIMLAAVGWAVQPTARRKRIWLAIVGTVTVLLLAMGIILALSHRKLSVY